jgi:hypothetical protein
MNEINWSPTKKMIRAFSLKLILSFPFVGLFWTLLIFLLGTEKTWDWRVLAWIGGVGVSAGIISLISSRIGRLIWIFWYSIIVAFDKVIVWTTLPVFFFLIFFPYSMIIRIFRKTPIRKTLADSASETYWTDEKAVKADDQYFRQF